MSPENQDEMNKNAVKKNDIKNLAEEVAIEKEELKELKKENDKKNDENIKEYVFLMIILNIVLVIGAVYFFVTNFVGAIMNSSSYGLAVFFVVLVALVFIFLAFGIIVFINVIIGFLFAMPSAVRNAKYKVKSNNIKMKELKTGKYKDISLDTKEGQKVLKKDSIGNCAKTLVIGLFILFFYCYCYYESVASKLKEINGVAFLIPRMETPFKRLEFLLPYTETKFIVICISILVIITAICIFHLLPWIKYKKEIKEDTNDEKKGE